MPVGYLQSVKLGARKEDLNPGTLPGLTLKLWITSSN